MIDTPQIARAAQKRTAAIPVTVATQRDPAGIRAGRQ